MGKIDEYQAKKRYAEEVRAFYKKHSGQLMASVSVIPTFGRWNGASAKWPDGVAEGVEEAMHDAVKRYVHDFVELAERVAERARVDAGNEVREVLEVRKEK